MVRSFFFNAVKQLSKHDMVTGMEISPGNIKGHKCVPCLEGKQTQDEIPSQSNTIHPHVLYCIYSELCGPMQTWLHHGKYYFLTFINGNAHHVKVKLLVTKSETCKMIIALIKQAEVETGEWVNFFCSNGGGEFGSKELADYFESKGINHKKMNTYTPQENVITEQINRTIVKMAHTLLLNENLPLTYWCFTVIYAAYIINQSPTHTLNPKPYVKPTLRINHHSHTWEFFGVKPMSIFHKKNLRN